MQNEVLSEREEQAREDKKTSKLAIASIVGEVLSARNERRDMKIDEKQKELSKAYSDENKTAHNKYRFFLSLATTILFIYPITILTDGILEGYIMQAIFTIAAAALIYDEMADKGYVKKYMPEVRGKTDLEIDMFTYAIFGYTTEFKTKKLFFFSSAIIGLLTALSLLQNEVIMGVVGGLLTVFYIIIIYFFENMFIQIKK